MRIGRAGMAVIILTIVFISFSAGFLGGRMTAGETFTIAAESGNSTKTPAFSENQAASQPNKKADSDPTVSAVSAEPSAEAVFPVNINRCGADELMQLPSIGETRAADIIAYRTVNGPFRNKADIMQVTGIGEATYDKIKAYITVNEIIDNGG